MQLTGFGTGLADHLPKTRGHDHKAIKVYDLYQVIQARSANQQFDCLGDTKMSHIFQFCQENMLTVAENRFSSR